MSKQITIERNRLIQRMARKEYKSNGSLIRSKTDYYQAIGG